MSSSGGPDQFESTDYLGMLRRRWWVWIGVTILCVLGALAYLKLTPKTYSASASVYVTPTAAGQGNNQLANSRTSGSAVNLDTEAVVVKSGQVAQIAAKTLKSPLSPGALAAQVTVAVPPNSEVLQISCSAGKPQAAADCAQAFAKAYLQNRDTQAAQSISAQLKSLQSKIASLQKTAAGLSAQIASLPSNAPSRASAQTDLNADNSELTQLSNQVAALTTAAAANSGGSVITDAVPPAASSPTTPKKKIVLPSGLVAGLVIGFGLAYLRDRRDKRIRGAHDVERFLGLPAMLTVPAVSSGERVASASLGSGQPTVELAHAVAAELGRGDHILLVAGVSPGPTGGMVAADLAAGLARTHATTVLVCAHSDSAAPRALLGAADGRGLSDMLAGVASLEEVIHETAIPGLTVVTPGTHRSFTAAQRTLAAADKLVTQLRATAQYVVIDVQATQEEADTFTLAQFADGALVVVEERRTTRDEAIETIRRLRLFGTHVLGVVLSSARHRRRARGRATRQRQPWLESAPKPAEDYALPAGNGAASPAGNGSLRAAGSDDATVVLGARPLSATSATQARAERPAPLRAERDDLPDTAHGS
ncbi:MAG TPA: Wzz/FepE/Etk N-terminal domain-containing protein [Streptosporangiaceae bacterium]|nr:Wzz/FepE/Etk N-terminal domain-containing protein [Streptosporangiaceae bacterium]